MVADGVGSPRLALILAVVSGQLAVSAQLLPPPKPSPASESARLAARLSIMRAEDDRLPIPDDLHTPEIDARRMRLARDVQTLIEHARSRDDEIRQAALRTTGRYERRELAGEILPQVFLPVYLPLAAFAPLAQSMRGPVLPDDPGDQQLRAVLEALLKVGDSNPLVTTDVAQALGRLPYTTADQARAADGFLTTAFARLDPDQKLRVGMALVAQAADSRARLTRQLAPLDEDTVDWLRRIVRGTRRTYLPVVRASAMSALVSAVALDAETLKAAAEGADADDVRRMAAQALAGAGSAITGDERTDLLRPLLSDRSPPVRYEAVRAWARREAPVNGCQPLIDALRDETRTVVLAAIDLMADLCRDDANVTNALTTIVRTPPASGDWHRESHALVALARRLPERAALAMSGHVSHQIWQVRMYAARAAALMNDTATLERLAADPVDNVREATLAPLRRLKGAEADAQFVAALESQDYQLLRTAANELKGARPTAALAAALAEALKRVTADRKDTSRDVRLALIERLGELGCPEQASLVAPLLQDFDVAVALAAGSLLQRWTGRAQEVAPQLLPRPALPLPAELEDPSIVTIKMESGRSLDVSLMWSMAPLTVARFVRLVRAGHYDGLAFHRIVPNFIVQGGSPGSNDYVGDGAFMRDEVGGRNRRGALGIPARARDTGDGQFYINLVDNPRLDHEYTVFASVCDKGMEVVDGLLEGDRMQSIRIARPTRTCRSR